MSAVVCSAANTEPGPEELSAASDAHGASGGKAHAGGTADSTARVAKCGPVVDTRLTRQREDAHLANETT